MVDCIYFLAPPNLKELLESVPANGNPVPVVPVTIDIFETMGPPKVDYLDCLFDGYVDDTDLIS